MLLLFSWLSLSFLLSLVVASKRGAIFGPWIYGGNGHSVTVPIWHPNWKVQVYMIGIISKWWWWWWWRLGGGNSNMLHFPPYLGTIPILTNIFQMGWFNHQPDDVGEVIFDGLIGGWCLPGHDHTCNVTTDYHFSKEIPLWGSRIIFLCVCSHSFRGFSMRCKDPTSMKNAGLNPKNMAYNP